MYKAYMIDENEISELISDYPEEVLYPPIVDTEQLKINLRKILFHTQSTNMALKASTLWDSFFSLHRYSCFSFAFKSRQNRS